MAGIADLAARWAKHATRDELEFAAEVAHYARAKMRVDPASCYFPHPKQQLFHDAGARFRLLLGGNRSGKSHCGTWEGIAHALGFRPWKIPSLSSTFQYIHDWNSVPEEARIFSSFGVPLKPPTSGLIVADGFESGIMDIIVPKLKEHATPYISEWHRGAAGNISRCTFVNGSTITFKSYDQPAKKFEGTAHHWIAFDEPPPEPIWVACRRGLVDYGGRAWWTLTPLYEPWLYDRVYMRYIEGDEEYWATHMSFFDNPYRERDAKFLEDLTEEEAEARIHGRFIHLVGRIFKQWDPDVHVIPDEKLNPNWPRIQIVDPHGARPWITVYACITPGDDIVIEREWPTKPLEKIQRVSMTYDDYARVYHEIEDGQLWRVAERIMDPNFGRSRAVGSTRTVAEEMGLRDFYYDTSVNDDIDSGYFKVMDYLRYDPDKPVNEGNKPRLRVFHSCRNTRVSMERHVQDPKKREAVRNTIVPHPKWKDIPDCLRYLCMTEPSFMPIEAFMWTGDRPERDRLHPMPPEKYRKIPEELWDGEEDENEEAMEIPEFIRQPTY